jgi:hypothetical protein
VQLSLERNCYFSGFFGNEGAVSKDKQGLILQNSIPAKNCFDKFSSQILDTFQPKTTYLIYMGIIHSNI